MAVSQKALQDRKAAEALEKANEVLEKQGKATTKAVFGNGNGKASPNELFGGQWVQSGTNPGWPMKQLERISKAYNDDSYAMALAGSSPGRMKGLGWGRELVALADSIGFSTQYEGKFRDNPERLHKEMGLVSVEKAARDGIQMSNGQVRKTALAESGGATGGYIVPPQYMNELLTIAAEDAFIEPRCKILPMTTRTAWWPMLDITALQALGVTPYFGGVLATWQPEAALINETEPAFKQTEWTAWDLVLYSVSSNQLLADNGIGLDALLTQLFAQAMTWYKEFAFLQGRGAGNSMPLGVLNAPATFNLTRTTIGKFVLPDVAGMMAHLQIRSWDTACWIMHQSVLPQLIQMQDYTGSSNVGNHLVWLTPFGDGKVGPFAMKMPNAFFNGLPLYFTEKLPTLGNRGDVLLVDWSRYVVGQRLDYQIDVSPHFLFRNNQLAWRVVARADGKPWLNSVITDAAGWQISPFCCLV